MCICSYLHSVEFTIASIRKNITGSKSREVDERLAGWRLAVMLVLLPPAVPGVQHKDIKAPLVSPVSPAL